MIARAHAPVRRDRPHGLLVGLLFAVLAGVFGMHGLGAHGIGGFDHTPAAAHAGVDAGRGEIGRLGEIGAAMFDVANPTLDPLFAAGQGGGADGMGLGDLCVAVLSALGLTLLLAWMRRSGGEVLLLARAQPSRAPLPRGRDRDPPSLARLSVLRR